MSQGAARDIKLDVLNGDVLHTPCDVLVLKYAQALHGVDRAAAEALGLELTPTVLPPGGFRFYPTAGRVLGAESVLFVGVRQLRDFGYREIREFSYKAMCSLAGESDGQAHVVFTLHGAGYGLDESECFRAELAGIIDAALSGDLPSTLNRISFVERNPGRCERLRTLLARELPGALLTTDPRPLQRQLAHERSVLRSVGYDSAEKPLVFVAMPINEGTEDLFRYGIEKPVTALDCLCERIDRTPGTGDLPERIKAKIASSRFVVAELSDHNPNVFLEVGFAWGRRIPTVLLVRQDRVNDLPFDVKTQTCLVYDSIHDLESKLPSWIDSLINPPSTVS